MRLLRYAVSCLVVLVLLGRLAGPLGAQVSPDTLNQLVAPVALYPDSLVTQVLMASCYPQEVVEASQWVTRNPGLSAQDRAQALSGKTWDPSVSSLTAFPDLLKRMSTNLDWTQALGEAFLGQQADVLQAVQNMRSMAKSAGTLQSTSEQTVSTDQGVISINPASPDNWSLPYYDPSGIYGTAWGATPWIYPGVYTGWAGYPGGRAVAFGAGVAVGKAMYGNVNWANRSVYVNSNYTTYAGYRGAAAYNTTRTTAGTTGAWQYNPYHRQGVNYSNPTLRTTYSATGSTVSVPSNNLRGYTNYSSVSTPGGTTPYVRTPGAGAAAPANKYWSGPTTSTPAISQSAFQSQNVQQRAEFQASQRGAASMGGGSGMYGRAYGGASRPVNMGNYGGMRGGVQGGGYRAGGYGGGMRGGGRR